MSSQPDSAEDADPACILYISGEKGFLEIPDIRHILKDCGELTDIRHISPDDGVHDTNASVRVTFKRAEDAKKLLLGEDPRIKFIKTYLHVSSTLPSTPNYRTYTGPIDPEQSPICRLDDECLLHLYPFLDLRDQYNLSRLCERFSTVFRTVFQVKHKIFFDWETLDSKISQQEWWHLLHDCGHLVESLSLKLYDREDITYVATYCPNLKVLKTLGQSFPYGDEMACFDGVDNLKLLNSVHLQKMRFEDGVFENLSRIDSLEILVLNGCHIRTYDYFDYPLRNLKILDTFGSELDADLIVNICKSAPDLTTLGLINYDHMWEDPVGAIVQHCQNLREISLDISYDISEIARLRNLEKLTVNICGWDSSSDNLFRELVTHAKHKLRVLEILSYYETSSIDFDFEMECVCKLTALEELNLKHILIDNDFLKKLASSLPNLKCFQSTHNRQLGNKEIVDFIRSAPKLEKFYITENYNNPELVSLVIDALKEKKPPLGKPFVLTIGDCTDKKHLKSMQNFISPNSHIVQYDSWHPTPI